MNHTLHSMFIGMCMWEPSIVYHTKVTPRDFNGTEAIVFEAMQAIVKEGGIPDEGTIHARTGISLTTLFEYKDTDFASKTPNWHFYEKQIRETTANKILRTKAESILRNTGMSSNDIVSLLQDAINEVQNDTVGFEICDIKTTINSTVETILERSKQNKRCIGIPSGISRLDDMTQGFQDRRLYYIGGRPGQGKTALLINFAENCPKRCGIISAESGKEELTSRMLSRKSLIDSQRLNVGVFRTGELERFGDAASNLYDHAGIYTYDEPNSSIDTVVNIARQMKRRFDIEILFVDYLQCLTPGTGMGDKPYHQQVAQMSKALKHLARTLNIPVVVAAQLKRDAEGNRPQLSDFSDTTQIERDADVVIMIYNKYDKENVLTDTYLLIEKNRDGRRGDVPVSFKQEFVSFTDLYRQ